jgi:outer membrane receptor protein involved in Fe transport
MTVSRIVRVLSVVSLAASPALAQTTTTQNPPATERVTLPEVTVTAQKEPAKAQELPVSVTAITSGMLERAGVTIISEAAFTVPNTVFTEFTARKLSNARRTHRARSSSTWSRWSLFAARRARCSAATRWEAWSTSPRRART